MGYYQAGFDVIGVDIAPQPNYPFEFVRSNVITMDRSLLRRVDAIHASPPCQRHTMLAIRNGNVEEHVDVVAQTRKLLRRSKKPYVIENVPAAPLIEPIMLCGEMFGLRVIRHRCFESNVGLIQPDHIPHRGTVNRRNHSKNNCGGYYFGVHGNGGGFGTRLIDYQRAMKIRWMTKPEIVQAIPPAYTKYIGTHLITRI